MASAQRRLLPALAALAAGLALALALLPVGLAFSADKVAFTIKDPRITESSGLTRDVRSHIYWTVNDSGDAGNVYGLASDGAVKGILSFRAQPEDVEAVAVSDTRLYVADIGDNLQKRDFVTVFFFSQANLTAKTVTYRSYDFLYPDGPHDAETLLVNDKGKLFLVTKGKKGGIYTPVGPPTRQGINSLERVGNAPAYVTDGVFLPGGKQIALRTYVSVVVVDAKSYKTVAEAPTPTQPQGESIAVSLDGKSLLVGSEGKMSKVYSMPIPTSIGKVPKASSSPPPTPKTAPSPTPSSTAEADDPVDDPSADTSTSRAGTVLAIVVAAFVAVVAGVVVVAVRKP